MAGTTDTDGVAVLVDVPPPGAVTVSATQPGSTFKSHPMTIRAGKFTTSVVTK